MDHDPCKKANLCHACSFADIQECETFLNNNKMMGLIVFIASQPDVYVRIQSYRYLALLRGLLQ